LADQTAEDPLAKVKVLVQELIERLLKEAGEEANHKGWCDKELALASQERNSMADSVKELNGKLSRSEARIEKVSAELEVLNDELDKLGETLSKADEVRRTEKDENAHTIEEAQKGADTVASAIDTLEKFYKTAAKEGQSFVQIQTRNSPDEDAPDAGFDSAYTGEQGAATGVIGMLEVVKSDYERTVALTKQAEEEADAAFKELSTQTEASQAAKNEAHAATEKALGETTEEDEQNRERLTADQGRLNNAITQLLSLHKACFDNGETAEERKAKREEEISALNQALCILDAHNVGGADSC
jgi:hypothetical protein